MKRIPPIITFTLLRLVLFVLPLVALVLLGIEFWIAVVAAALIGLCLSYLLLSRPRDAVARDIYARRHREKPLVSEDDDAEDAATAAAEHIDTTDHDAGGPGARP